MNFVASQTTVAASGDDALWAGTSAAPTAVETTTSPVETTTAGLKSMIVSFLKLVNKDGLIGKNGRLVR